MPDEITTSESFGPSRRKTPNVTSEPAPAVSSDQPASGQLFRNSDVAAIRKSTDAIRQHAMTLPSSDALADVLLAVSSIDFALESIDLGLQAAETDDSAESTPA